MIRQKKYFTRQTSMLGYESYVMQCNPTRFWREWQKFNKLRMFILCLHGVFLGKGLIFPSGNANLGPLVIISSTVVESSLSIRSTLSWHIVEVDIIWHCLIRTPTAWGYSHKQPDLRVNAVNELLFAFFIRKSEHRVCLFLPGVYQSCNNAFIWIRTAAACLWGSYQDS